MSERKVPPETGQQRGNSGSECTVGSDFVVVDENLICSDVGGGLVPQKVQAVEGIREDIGLLRKTEIQTDQKTDQGIPPVPTSASWHREKPVPSLAISCPEDVSGRSPRRAHFLGRAFSEELDQSRDAGATGRDSSQPWTPSRLQVQGAHSSEDYDDQAQYGQWPQGRTHSLCEGRVGGASPSQRHHPHLEEEGHRRGLCSVNGSSTGSSGLRVSFQSDLRGEEGPAKLHPVGH